MKQVIAILMLVTLLVGPGLSAQADDDNPVIALLRWSDSSVFDRATEGMFDVLVDYGLVGQYEVTMAQPGADFYGDNITILWRDAGRDITLANVMIEEALDEGATILVTLATVISELAVNIVSESGIEPTPLVIFSLVTAPYTSDIADGPCEKPTHVVGTHVTRDYVDILGLLTLLDRDIQLIGTYENPGHANSVLATIEITEAAAAHGYETTVEPTLQIADVPIATDKLLDDGVDAIVIGPSGEPNRALPVIIEAAAAYGVPVMTVVPSRTSSGAHIGAGFNAHYREGVVQGQLLVAALEGRLDAANTSIHAKPSTSVALNLDTLAGAGVTITPGLLDRADWVIANGQSTHEFVKPPLTGFDIEERRAIDDAFIDSLACEN